ncbi:MAG: polyketide synthase dehydratase domain-containing protein [Candidatus Competibacter sp.]|nr:polyketide synthase dehydratase domain-containing protein [Candidatus Competibacter sp.]
MAPRLEGEELAIARAYRETGIDPRGVTLIEAHGTGIPLGDKTEIAALARVMSARRGDLPICALGSVKSMISHCIPAAGIAGLIKTALALYHKVLPPTLCEQVNPDLEIEKTPFYINTEPRPWIHPQDRPRRAGVNAFGFGGINTHAILEEDTESSGPALPMTGVWGSELVVLSADSRVGLLAEIERIIALVRQQLEPSPDRASPDAIQDGGFTLRDLAYTLAREPLTGRQRLAIVAASLDDLRQKLERAGSMLGAEQRHLIQARSGIYFTDQPLEGKLAFMFPGEGSQYRGMLAELAVYLPLVREWFDFWDTLYQGQQEVLPSQIVFQPPTGVDAAVREMLETRLNDVAIGSEAVFIASQALFALLSALGLGADAMVGHSSGENTAMVAAGVMRLVDREKLRQYILNLKQLYQRIGSLGVIASGCLLTVGAVEREKVLEVVAGSAGQLHLALDNCQHQAVLFGPKVVLEEAAAELRRAGGLCAYLSIDRPYHTPLFEPVARAIEEFLQDIPVGPGRIPLYSCASAGPFPDDAPAIKCLAARQWSSRVRFMETVRRLYADGVRLFVEVGPASNLTGFVQDILRDEPHLAVSCDNRSRSGLIHLQHALARLFVHGRALNLRYLFEGRDVRIIDPRQPPKLHRRPPRLENTLPFVRLDPAQVTEIRRLLEPLRFVEVPDSIDPLVLESAQANVRSPRPLAGEGLGERVEDSMAHPLSPMNGGEGTERLPAQYAAATAPSLHDPGAELLERHLNLMQAFLNQQERIMKAALGGEETSPGGPFIARLLELNETTAVAEFDFIAAEQRFLRDHILYAVHVSDLNPALHGLSVVPLAVSLEMLAEVAALVSTKPVLRALENVTAYNWIALDDGEKTVRLVARRVDVEGDRERLHAALYEGEAMLVEGDVVFAQTVATHGTPLPALVMSQPSRWRDDQLYATTGMFHGPLFQSIRHLIAWDGTGMDVELADTPARGFFAGDTTPAFLLNPVLLDAVGHLTAFWISESVGTDFSSFPSRVQRIELFAPAIQATAGYRLRGRLSFLEGQGAQGRVLQGDYDCLDLTGAAIYQITGWRDRFFPVPHRFYFARTNPREGWYGESWRGLFPNLPRDTIIWAVPSFETGFLDDAGAIWKRVLAHTVLATEERESWRAIQTQTRQASEWLLGRVALKEAVRCWYWQHSGVLLLPSDVDIVFDESGKPYVAARMLAELGPPPRISLSHVEGLTIAVAGPPEYSIGIDMQMTGRMKTADFIQSALNLQEREKVEFLAGDKRDEMVLRIWAAKEAAAKKLGLGVKDWSSVLEVTEISPNGTSAVVSGFGVQIAVSIRRHGEMLVVLTHVD